MAHRLAGKVALITGAAQGIGKACAELFAKEDAFVFVTDVNDDLGQKTAREIGPQAHYFRLDVQNDNDWDAAIQQVIKKRNTGISSSTMLASPAFRKDLGHKTRKMLLWRVGEKCMPSIQMASFLVVKKPFSS